MCIVNCFSDTPGFKKEEYISHIENLINSTTFSRSKNSQKILEYFKEKLQEEDINSISEKIIAYEVFDKDLQYDPTVDSFIRVLFYRFRNTLTEYYLYEGDCEKIELYFPKGTYVPHFRRKLIGNKINKDDQFEIIKNMLSEKILFRLRTLFMMTLKENDLDLIIEYYESLNESEISPFAIAIYHEMILFNRILFMKSINEKIEEISISAEIQFKQYTYEDHVYVPVMLICILQKNYTKLDKLSTELYEKTHQAFYKGVSCMMRSFICQENSLMKELQVILELRPNLSVFWYLPNVLCYLRKGQMYDAICEVNNMNQYPSHLSKTLLIVLKNKLNKLTNEDNEYIEKNRQFFCEEFLNNFLFELAPQYALI